MARMDLYEARIIAEAINCFRGTEHRMQIITADEVLNLSSPLYTNTPSGSTIYAYQWGEVTIVVCISKDGYVNTQHINW